MNNGFYLIGVGGGACRCLNATCENLGGKIDAANTIGLDTDALANCECASLHCRIIGNDRYEGRSTGGDAVKGRLAFCDDAEKVVAMLPAARFALVVTTLGGGVGCGATPELLRRLRNNGICTICIATLPFAFEGPRRAENARRALPLIKSSADAVIEIPLDTLFKDAPLESAIKDAQATLTAILTLFNRILVSPNFITLSPEDIIAIVRECGGDSRVSIASAEGADRASEAVKALLENPLLANHSAAQAVILGAVAGDDLRLAELTTITETFRAAIPTESFFRMAAVLDHESAPRLQLVAFFLGNGGVANRAVAKEPEQQNAILELTGMPTRPSRRKRSPRTPAATGRFNGVEPTIINDQNLDTPSYVRRGITLER